MVPTAPKKQPKSSFPFAHPYPMALHSIPTSLVPNLISSELVQTIPTLSAYSR